MKSMEKGANGRAETLAASHRYVKEEGSEKVDGVCEKSGMGRYGEHHGGGVYGAEIGCDQACDGDGGGIGVWTSDHRDEVTA
ncbi:hypothetical protein H0H92_004216 [Tricholoma furcatifolium]|nr:hypothetical protein H0H92_004216 [Tricholoma furcatifolium]